MNEEVSNSIKALQIEDNNDLKFCLDAGLTDLYRECFGAHPYYEYFSNDDVKDIFEDYAKKQSSILVLFDENKETVVGFSVKTPMRQCSDIVEIVKGSVNNIDTCYYGADLGVRAEYRKHGLSFYMEQQQKTNFIRSFSQEITRTSAANYRRIAGNLKSGKKRLSYIEEVTMPRTDGSIQSDKRIYFEQILNKEETADFYLNRVVIARPAGNDTAIVFDNIPREEQGGLSRIIQDNYPGVEQVMFVEKIDNEVYGRMAGGEFCGNATRSLAFVLASDGYLSKNKNHLLNVSGSSFPLEVRVTDAESSAQMPVRPGAVNIRSINEGETIVDLEGISFLILKENSANSQTLSGIDNQEDKKRYVMKLLEKYNLDEKSASGVLQLNIKGAEIFMEPYVFVRDTKTLYYETACGSGTTAVGMLLISEQNKTCGEYKIIQPSGKSISVTVESDNGFFTRADISGEVDILFDGNMPLNRRDTFRIPNPVQKNEIK